jgi:hypothetical protein
LESINTTEASIKLLFARPNETSVGGPATSIKVIKNTLENSVLPRLIESCFDEKTGIEYFGKVKAQIASDGYALKFSIAETNTDESQSTCIKEIFTSTLFPEPTDEPEEYINYKGEKELLEPRYNLTIKFQIKK